MLSPKTVIFFIVFLYFAGWGLLNPILGIFGYILVYIIGPEKTWWHAPLNPLGIRYSLTFAIIIAIGICINQNRLRFGPVLVRQEKIVLALLALIWMMTILGEETIGRYTSTDGPFIKMTKVMIFCLMLTHVVTNAKDLDKIFWVFVIGGLILGIQAWDLPRSAFTQGRLDARIGGSDFLDANALAIFMVACTVIIGVTFMRSDWPGKILCMVAGVFSVNTIVLCRSRGAMLALIGAGIAIFFTVPRRFRPALMIGLVVAMAGMLYLSDAAFLERIGQIASHADSVLEGAETSDRSAMMRIEAWRGGLQMLGDHPFGVGPGNFNQYIGNYSPSIVGLSPHSLYIQVSAELGYIGLAILLAILSNALWTLRKINNQSELLPEPVRTEFQWRAVCLTGIICAYITFGITAHLMYVEAFWWFFMMPACLQRALDNAHHDLALSAPPFIAE